MTRDTCTVLALLFTGAPFMNFMNDSAFTKISAPGMHHVHMRPVRYYDNIVYQDTIFLLAIAITATEIMR